MAAIQNTIITKLWELPGALPKTMFGKLPETRPQISSRSEPGDKSARIVKNVSGAYDILTTRRNAMYDQVGLLDNGFAGADPHAGGGAGTQHGFRWL